MTVQDRLQAERRRVNFFAGTHRRADEADLASLPLSDDPQRASDQSLEQAALSQIRKAIESRADAMRFKIPEAALADMLSKAQSALRGMTRSQLQSLSLAGGSVETIANTSFNTVVTADPKLTAALQAARGEPTSAEIHAQQLARLERLQMVSSATRDREIGGSEVARERQAMDGARAEATKLGMPWAMNNPDLLRLGPSAIRTLHEAGVRRETFERMTSERVGIRAATAVHLAEWARRHNLTLDETNRIMNSQSDVNAALSRGRPPEERRRVQEDLDRALDRFALGDNTPETRKVLEDERMRHARTDQEREQVRQKTRELERVRQVNLSATVSRNSNVSQINQEKVRTEDTFAALNTEQPANNPAVNTPPSVSAQPRPNAQPQRQPAPGQ